MAWHIEGVNVLLLDNAGGALGRNQRREELVSAHEINCSNLVSSASCTWQPRFVHRSNCDWCINHGTESKKVSGFLEGAQRELGRVAQMPVRTLRWCGATRAHSPRPRPSTPTGEGMLQPIDVGAQHPAVVSASLATGLGVVAAPVEVHLFDFPEVVVDADADDAVSRHDRDRPVHLVAPHLGEPPQLVVSRIQENGNLEVTHNAAEVSQSSILLEKVFRAILIHAIARVGLLREVIACPHSNGYFASVDHEAYISRLASPRLGLRVFSHR